MPSLLVLRIMLIVVLLTATTFGSLAIAFWKFPLSVIILAVCFAAIFGACFYVNRETKRARFESFYATVQAFGTPIIFENTSAAFERGKTRFDIEFPKDEDNPSFKVNFFLPNFREKFIIQHKSMFLKSLPDCNYLENSLLAPDVYLFAQNPEFLLRLVQNENILNEINEYPVKFFSRFIISFDDGSFEMEWTPKIDEQADGVYKICQTAVVFHDELKESM